MTGSNTPGPVDPQTPTYAQLRDRLADLKAVNEKCKGALDKISEILNSHTGDQADKVNEWPVLREALEKLIEECLRTINHQFVSCLG